MRLTGLQCLIERSTVRLAARLAKKIRRGRSGRWCGCDGGWTRSAQRRCSNLGLLSRRNGPASLLPPAALEEKIGGRSSGLEMRIEQIQWFGVAHAQESLRCQQALQ